MNVYIIDDEETVRDSLSWLFESRELTCSAFPSGEAFLEALPSLAANEPSCIVLDLRMEPNMSGIELFNQLLDLRHNWPIIFLSGHGDISLAVNAVQQGAFNFLEKPFADNVLVDHVFEALAQSKSRIARAIQSDLVQEKITLLSNREISVMESILKGLSNRDAAAALDMSVRTVEVHRANLFKKMGVKGAVELTNLLQMLDV